MKSPLFAALVVTGTASLSYATSPVPSDAKPSVLVDTTKEPLASGKFQPTWESLRQYEIPEWFRDAKFGIWAHWGPQCAPEAGDWYARAMYIEGDSKYKSHLARYGHPSKSGFKDVIYQWRAENWRPDELVQVFKRAGARYFIAMANHHDNLDLWDSKYQPWNSAKIGPKEDIIAGWAKAAKKADLPFGVSVHASHAWTWYEPAQGADKSGPMAGMAYDGKLRKEDGAGQWWDGLDPQDLYAQYHPPSAPGSNGSQWQWLNGASTPDQAYCDKFYNRTIDLINRVKPELVYFDDTALPLWPVSDAGLKIAAHYYNQNMRDHGGKLTGVIFGKWLTEDQKSALVRDIERGVSDRIEPRAWQTCTCLGDWHYARNYFNGGMYRSSQSVIRMLVDIVSKNGNLLLSVPIRGDGSIDKKEEKILAEIAGWMDTNKEAIYGTRPWKIFGERISETPPKAAGEFTANDIRFVTKGNILYATTLGNPQGDILIRALGKESGLLDLPITSIEQLGSGTVRWNQTDGALKIEPHTGGDSAAVVYKIALD